MIEAFLFFSALFLLLGCAVVINIFNIKYYSPVNRFQEQMVNISFTPIDETLLAALSFLMLLSPLIVKSWNYSRKWMATSYLMLIPFFIAYFLGLNTLAEIVLLFTGFSTFLLTLNTLRLTSILAVKKALTHILIYTLLMLNVIEFIALLHWSLQPFCTFAHLFPWTWNLASLENQLFYIPAMFTPFFFVIFLFSWITKPFFSKLAEAKSVRVKIGGRQFYLSIHRHFDSKFSVSQNFSKAILMCSMILAAVFTVYPYMPCLNPDGHPIGVDTQYYADWLLNMQGTASETLRYAFLKLKDRPLSLLFMYTLWKADGFSSLTVAEFTPLILAPLLVLVVYYFSREAKFSYTTSAFSSFFAAVSFHLTTGVFACFISNWMALIDVYLFSGLLLKSIRNRSYRWGCLAAIVMVLMIFTHANTWGMIMGVLVVFTFFLSISQISKKRLSLTWDLKLLLVILIVNVAMNTIRNWVLSFGTTVEVLGVARSGLSLYNLVMFWKTLSFTINLYLFRTYLNPIIFFFGFLGAFTMLLKGNYVVKYLTAWLTASTFPFVFGNMVIQARILYNLPIPIFAAYGLYSLVCFIKNKVESSSKIFNSKTCYLLIILLTVFICLNYALRLLFAFSQTTFS